MISFAARTDVRTASRKSAATDATNGPVDSARPSGAPSAEVPERTSTSPPDAGWWLTIGLTLLTTILLYGLQSATLGHGPTRPFGIAYIIPIAIATLFGDSRKGIVALAMALGFVCWFMVRADVDAPLYDPRNLVELAFLFAVGSIVIYGVESAKMARHFRSIVSSAEARLIESERQRLQFSRDVLLAVTGGRLLLCQPYELADVCPAVPAVDVSLVTPADVAVVRAELRRLTGGTLTAQRVGDVLTSATEAATNAIKHAGGGRAKLWLDDVGVNVLVTDHGPGINPNHLARVTLEQGYSTRSTLGIGFTLMLQFVDHIVLATGADGTSIKLQVGRGPIPTPAESILARYSDLQV